MEQQRPHGEGGAQKHFVKADETTAHLGGGAFHNPTFEEYPTDASTEADDSIHETPHVEILAVNKER